MINYTAKYTKIASGYMGQLVEWPEVVTEGKDLEDCRAMLRDALNEMILAYKELGKEVPLGNALIEQLAVEVEHVGQAT
ncbi:MAG: type II toxin-antitoxin system HicB family antitoxin [Desulfobacterales bacterium]|jgi:predicted RNase H-like HicB family nuclease|nr:MAG: type II toxin-antitoxin system HicB family antitoxin [Desulfobacterales bacterium]